MSDQTAVGSARGRTPPGPQGLPLVGSLPAYWRDPYAFITRLAREYGEVARYSVLGEAFYQLNTPEAIEHVLIGSNENYVKGDLFQESLGPVTGNGILNSEGEFWRRNRRLIEPAFHPRRIERYAEMMVGRTEATTGRWSDGEVRDVHDELMGLTLRIVAEALFGADVEGEVDTVGGALDTVLTFQENLFRTILPVELPTPARRRFDAAVEDLDRVVYRIVDEKLDELAADAAASTDGGSAVAAADVHDDVVSTLLSARDESGERMSRRQIRDEVMTLLLAGHETTALALTFTVHALARHPGVEERLVAELDDVLDGEPPTMADVPELTYLDQVVTESLRLHPPVPGIVREPIEDDVIAGYRVPAGATVTMNQWTVHRDPRFYDDPLAFRPERWTDDLRESLPPLAYFPFSAGPRRCIGDRFARLEAKLILATVLQEYHLELVAPAELDLLATITARPVDPIEMRVQERGA